MNRNKVVQGCFASLVGVVALSSSVTYALEDSQISSLRQVQGGGQGDHWTDKIQLGGHAAAGLIRTGAQIDDYRRKNFIVHEVNTTWSVNPNERTNFSLEIYPIGFQPATSNSGTIHYVGEAYTQFKNVLTWGETGGLSIKLGRFDYPYGEDYMRQDAVDNPMITKNASWLWGWDEGIMLNSKWGDYGLTFAITDGAAARGTDDKGNKAWTAKLWGSPAKNLNLSASAHVMTDTINQEMWQGYQRFSKCTLPNIAACAAATNTAQSPQSFVHGSMVEVGGNYRLGGFLFNGNWGRINLAGQAPKLGRQLTYYAVEPLYNFGSKWYVVGRYSTIGTGSDTAGVSLSDALNSGSTQNLKSLSRAAVAVGHRLNPATTLKAEIASDEMQNIQGVSKVGNGRLNLGFQAAIRF